MNEYFAFTTQEGETVRLPFPADLPLDERDAYMAAQIAAYAPPAETPDVADPLPSDEE
ncbi:MAG: hypothetical protein ACOVSI_10740 [Gemmatimonas sp.]|jgi:hypothetical protein